MRHLRTRAQFQALLKQPPLAKTSHFALHGGPLSMLASSAAFVLDEAPDALWLGAMTPKRWARRAVTRNTIRRQVYAVGRDVAASLAAGAYLVRLRTAFARQQFPSADSPALRRAVRHELQRLFAQVAA